VAEQDAEALANHTLTEVRMDVPIRAERVARVVDLDGSDAFQADAPVDFAHEGVNG
jgi:hypothetical protein